MQLDDYYRTMPGGGASSYNLISESKNPYNDLITYTYEYKSETEGTLIDTIKFKKIDDTYKLIYFETKKM